MTALEVSLLSGGLTGLFKLDGVAVTYILQGRQQLALAQDERIRNRRAETYVAMLQYQGGGMVAGDIESATAREWAVRDELTAKVAAFASDEVRDLWQQSALQTRQADQSRTGDGSAKTHAETPGTRWSARHSLGSKTSDADPTSQVRFGR